MTRMNNLQVNVIHVTSTSCRLGHSLPKAAILRTLGILVLGCLKGPYAIMFNLCIDNFMMYKVPIAVSSSEPTTVSKSPGKPLQCPLAADLVTRPSNPLAFFITAIRATIHPLSTMVHQLDPPRSQSQPSSCPSQNAYHAPHEVWVRCLQSPFLWSSDVSKSRITLRTLSASQSTLGHSWNNSAMWKQRSSPELKI